MSSQFPAVATKKILTKHGEFCFAEKDLFSCYIKEIMFFHSCNGTNIFIRWKMECSIQLGFASLNGTFRLSLHENICTIALINIHYLYTIALHLGRQECKNYLLLHSSFMFILECSVFPVQSSDVCFTTRLLRNTSRVEFDGWLVKCFAWAKIIFQCFFF